MAPAGQLSKFELELYNLDRPEITNHKHQITNKYQISISNDQNIQRDCTVSVPKFLSAGNYAIWHKCRRIIRLVRLRRIGLCDLPFDLAQSGGELVEPFDICDLLFEFF